VFIGSYDERFYALDAATGDVRWSFPAGGRISGSPTVIDGVVYVSTLERTTYALDARTGKELWSFPDGKYASLVADEERAYLVGYTRLYGLMPTEP
jgi:outer membrane protein assembly factor BamB